MAIVADSTLIINERIISELANSTSVDLTPPSELVQMNIGKNGHILVGENAQGKMTDLKIRIVLGGSDDKFLNSLLTQANQRLSTFVPLTCKVSHIVRNAEEVNLVQHILGEGVFAQLIPASMNAEGDTEQAVAVYSFKFGRYRRVIT